MGLLRENSSTAPLVFFALLKEDKLSEFIGIRLRGCRGSMQNSAEADTNSLIGEIRNNFHGSFCDYLFLFFFLLLNSSESSLLKPEENFLI